jgi:phosphoribosylanthranilate isomerase
MTWVKICGITNLEDALVAVEAGADAVGFVFYEKSPRNVRLDEVSAITSHIPNETERVGVFVGNYPSKKFVDHAKLSAVQWYPTVHSLRTREPQEALVNLSIKIFYAVSALADLDLWPESGFNFDRWPDAGRSIRAILLDSGTPQRPGGSGAAVDWHLAKPKVSQITSGFNLILAGGLTPENVTEGMRILHPWGVDVSSGVEAKPGKKDPEKVRAFVKAVREADKANSN